MKEHKHTNNKKQENEITKENIEQLEDNNKSNEEVLEKIIQDKNKEISELIKEKEKLQKNLDEKKELDDKIIGLQNDNEQLSNKIKLSQAELINYRKRKDEEVSNMLKYANEDLIKELLVLSDNFERAIKLDDNNLTDELSKFLEGFKIIYATLVNILNKYGVEEINRVGEIFDPSLEQALVTDSDITKKNEEVLEVLLKGYKLKDKVIRPSSVKINQIEEMTENKESD